MVRPESLRAAVAPWRIAHEVHARPEAICQGKLLVVEPEAGKHQNITCIQGFKAPLRDLVIRKRGTVEVHDGANVRFDGFGSNAHDLFSA